MMVFSSSYRKTKAVVLLLLLLLSFVPPAYGMPVTNAETSQSISIPINQWNTLKLELTTLQSELIQCKTELQKSKRPQEMLSERLTEAERQLLKLKELSAAQKNDLTQLSKDAEELRISLRTLRQQIENERRVHRRQVWQSRLWCFLIGAGIGVAASH